MKRVILCLLCISLCLFHFPVTSVGEDATDSLIIQELIDNPLVLTDGCNSTAEEYKLPTPDIDPEDTVKVIIVLEDPSVLQEDPIATWSTETQNQSELLEQAQDAIIQEIEDTALCGEDLVVNYQYSWLLNGFAADVPFGSIGDIKDIYGVKQVLLQPTYKICTKENSDNAVSPVNDSFDFIGIDDAWAAGFTGKGVKIAMIDTGLDVDHQNFAALPSDKLTETSATKDSIAEVLPLLNATEDRGYLKVSDVYYNSKVPFGFNYYKNTLDITHDNDRSSDHGTHVAGIAAANQVPESEVVGVAPDAQLYIMKVFGRNDGAYPQDVLAALEDALILGADVVNLSLGSSSGFTSDIPEINAIYNRVSETNTILFASVGNDSTAGKGNAYGHNANLTENPDNAVIGQPSTFDNVLSVASIEQRDSDADGSTNPYQMSSFSSWGAAPDLSLEPDITAPGGNIYSTIKNGNYGYMSGTSMAAPHLSGMAALLVQFARESAVDRQTYREFLQGRLMSTAVPLVYDENTYYSPRVQGSGVANVSNGFRTKAYLKVENCDVPKAQLGDDAQRTGVYQFTFSVVNPSEDVQYFDLSTVVQTEDVMVTDEYTFMSSTPKKLLAETTEASDALFLTYDYDGNNHTNSHDAYLLGQAVLNGQENSADAFRYDSDGNGSMEAEDVQAYLDALVGNESQTNLQDRILRVDASETTDVQITVTLNDEDKIFLDTYYPNGGYVEGYSFLKSCTADGIDLSIPYLAFYGSWAAAPIIDTGEIWTRYRPDYDGKPYYNQHPHMLFSDYEWETSGIVTGTNPYFDILDFDYSHISVSPNGDGNLDSVDDIYFSLLRNAKKVTFRYTDMASGEIYHELTEEFVPKASYQEDYDQVVPFIYSWIWLDGTPLYNWKKPDGSALENNQKLLLEIEALGVDEKEVPETWSVPITVDLASPRLQKATKSVDPETGATVLTLHFNDNVAASAAGLLTADSSHFLHFEPVTVTPEPDENGLRNYTVSFTVPENTESVVAVFADYACNESFYSISVNS